MCGIVGFVNPQCDPKGDVLRLMTDALVHRGPDSEGARVFRVQDTVVGLGHRRLSIIDIAGGAQPMSNEDETVWISYNGEIYNHLVLRRELEALGHRYKTRSDTESILHAYEQWGPECLQRLRGMFAFAIWDGRKRRLFAARDRMGIKPLYYAHHGETLLFASEIKAICAAGWLRPEIAYEMLPEQMTLGYLAGEDTLFKGIKKLMPGHWMTWENGKLITRQYWDVPLPDDTPDRPDGEWVEEFTHLFRESVKMRLMSDVPLGVFLSGGLDSSSIAAVMAQEMSGRLKTFSVGFEADYYSEFNFAREVADDLCSDHHEVVLTPGVFFASLPELTWHEDEPIRSSPSIALYHVARLARDHVTVVLTGEGGDELFAGYDRYWATLFNLRWGTLYNGTVPRWIRERCIRETLWQWPLPLSVKKKISHTFLGHALRPEEIVFDNFYAIFPQRVHSCLFTTEMMRRVRHADPYRQTMRFYNNRNTGNPLDQLLYTDQKTYLVELLMKQDNMSMAASIESRVPFLDHHLVEFAVNVPQRLKLNGWSGKHLVKLAMDNILPESIRRRKKTGFPVPFNSWLRHGFDQVLRQILSDDRTRQRNIFNLKFIDQMLAEHRRGAHDHTEALWTVLSFELWARLFIDGESEATMREEIMNCDQINVAKSALA